MAGDVQGTTRTHLEIDGNDYVLSAESDLVELMSRIEAAARTEPTFIDLVVGDGFVSVLVTPHSRVIVSTESTHAAAQDDVVPQGSLLDWDF